MGGLSTGTWQAHALTRFEGRLEWKREAGMLMLARHKTKTEWILASNLRTLNARMTHFEFYLTSVEEY